MSMEVTRVDEAMAVNVAGHTGVQPLAVFGQPATPAEHFTVIYSHYLPGGTAEESEVPAETVYIVTDGQLSFRADDQEATLNPMDAVRLTPGTVRSVRNETPLPASMIVIRAIH